MLFYACKDGRNLSELQSNRFILSSNQYLLEHNLELKLAGFGVRQDHYILKTIVVPHDLGENKVR